MATAILINRKCNRNGNANGNRNITTKRNGEPHTIEKSRRNARSPLIILRSTVVETPHVFNTRDYYSEVLVPQNQTFCTLHPKPPMAQLQKHGCKPHNESLAWLPSPRG